MAADIFITSVQGVAATPNEHESDETARAGDRVLEVGWLDGGGWQVVVV